MNDDQKFLANKAIEENVEDTTARQVIRYVMACELWGQDTISPSNEYLGKKYGWSNDTTKVAISKAKRSQFITTTGYGKKRCLELNVGFLKGKMAEMYQKSLKPRADFSDVLPNTLPTTLPNGSPNSLPNSFGEENSVPRPQNEENWGYSNRNSNKNKYSSADASLVVEVSDSEESKVFTKKPKYPNAKTVFALWGKYPKNWERNTTQLVAAENLFEEKGLEEIQNALDWYKDVGNRAFCPVITSPHDLDSKWEKFEAFVEKNDV